MFYKFRPELVTFSVEPAVPYFRESTVAVTCCRCGERTIVPVTDEYADYRSLAEQYRSYGQKITERYERIAKDTEAMHGENPAAKYFSNEIQVMLMEMKKQFFPNRYDKNKDR